MQISSRLYALLIYLRDGYMIMISRKFGGIKLGQGGVARAFRNSGRGVIKTYIENS